MGTGWRLVLVFVLLLPAVLADHSLNGRLGYGELEPEWEGEVEQLSWKPRLYLMRNFLSEAECDHIIALGKGHLESSSVVDSKTGAWKKSDVRTSTGATAGRGQDQVISRIEKRIASVSMIPVEHQEGLQILHYQDGQKYEVHSDAFHDAKHQQSEEGGGQRIVTVLMYLSTPEEGGETVFPFADKKVEGPGWSDCARQGLAHHPRRGDAVMFYSLTPDGEVDPSSQHGSCPTLKGEKWSATKWIHVKSFGVAPPDPNACHDNHPHCKEWAFFDECPKNPGYMLANCKKSCRTCNKSPAELAAAVAEADAANAANAKKNLTLKWGKDVVVAGSEDDHKDAAEQEVEHVEHEGQRLASNADAGVSVEDLKRAVKVEVTKRTAAT